MIASHLKIELLPKEVFTHFPKCLGGSFIGCIIPDVCNLAFIEESRR